MLRSDEAVAFRARCQRVTISISVGAVAGAGALQYTYCLEWRSATLWAVNTFDNICLDECHDDDKMYLSNQAHQTGKQMKIQDKKMAKVISQNLHRHFDILKKKSEDNFKQERCEHCGQLMKTPYTQKWLANESNITYATIVHYFQGKRIPSISTLKKLADVLNVSISDLLEGVK